MALVKIICSTFWVSLFVIKSDIIKKSDSRVCVCVCAADAAVLGHFTLVIIEMKRANVLISVFAVNDIDV